MGFLPADRLSFARIDDPGLVHFRQLFVTRGHWGTGLARRLHAAAIDEARARGFTAMRLFTPGGQERARRFYEREGWCAGAPARSSTSASASRSPNTAARSERSHSSRPRRIASATAAARSLTPSFS